MIQCQDKIELIEMSRTVFEKREIKGKGDLCKPWWLFSLTDLTSDWWNLKGSLCTMSNLNYCLIHINFVEQKIHYHVISKSFVNWYLLPSRFPGTNLIATCDYNQRNCVLLDIYCSSEFLVSNINLSHVEAIIVAQ